MKDEKEKSLISVKRKRFWLKVGWELGITLFLAAATGLIAWRFLATANPPEHADVFWMVAFYTSVILIAGWLMYWLSPLAHIRLFRIFCFVVLFVWGCGIYFSAHVVENVTKESSIGKTSESIELLLSAPNRTVASFFPSRGGYEGVESHGKKIHYYVFHSAVLFYVALLTFATFGRGMINRIRRKVARSKRLNVFWGRSEPSLLLAQSIVDSDIHDQVCFCLPERLGDEHGRRSIVRDMDDMDAIWMFCDDSSELINNSGHVDVGQVKGLRHFFLSESGHDNVLCADRLVKTLRRIKKQRSGSPFISFLSSLSGGCLGWWWRRFRDKPYFYVRIDASEDEHLFLTWAANVKDCVRPVIIRESALIARNFIQKYPMYAMPGINIDSDTAKVSGEFRILLIGLGAVGRDILVEMVRNGQFEGSSGFSVDVIEEDYDVIRRFKEEYAEACREYDIRFPLEKAGVFPREGLPARIGDKACEEYITSHLNKYNRIVVCLQGDTASVNAVAKIEKNARLKGETPSSGVLFAKFQNPLHNRYAPKPGEKLHSLFSTENDENGKIIPCVTLFGNLEDIYTIRNIDAITSDKMAIAVNGHYCGLDKADDWKKAKKAWDSISYMSQQSSRASAQGVSNLLALLGYEIVAGRGDVPERLRTLLEQELSPVLLTLARNEHLRWNAYHRMMGFSCWDVLSEEFEKPKVGARIKANQLATLGRHADLVPFDDLPKVDCAIARMNDQDCAKTPADFSLPASGAQYYDLKICRSIHSIVCAAGCRIVSKATSDWAEIKRWKKWSSVNSADTFRERMTIFRDLPYEEAIACILKAEHNRWWTERLLAGWIYSEKRDDDKLTHHDMIPFEKLSHETQEKDKINLAAMSVFGYIDLRSRNMI